MEEVNKAYKKWDKERTEEAKELWYEAVRRFSKIHGDKNEWLYKTHNWRK